jgi:hypothetical protein
MGKENLLATKSWKASQALGAAMTTSSKTISKFVSRKTASASYSLEVEVTSYSARRNSLHNEL